MATFDNPRETWNARYAATDYLFGEAPNEFLRRAADRLVAGQSVLCVADGEGRNSVWLAERGLRVTAFDFAPNAVEKARQLARRRDVHVDHSVADMQSWRFAPDAFDALAAIFIQFMAGDERDAAFVRMQSTVRPGGVFLLEGYGPRQLDYRTGGPGVIENLYTTEWVDQTFAGWDILELRDYDAELQEGNRHTGTSALIDLVARKR